MKKGFQNQKFKIRLQYHRNSAIASMGEDRLSKEKSNFNRNQIKQGKFIKNAPFLTTLDNFQLQPRTMPTRAKIYSHYTQQQPKKVDFYRTIGGKLPQNIFQSKGKKNIQIMLHECRQQMKERRDSSIKVSLSKFQIIEFLAQCSKQQNKCKLDDMINELFIKKQQQSAETESDAQSQESNSTVSQAEVRNYLKMEKCYSLLISPGSSKITDDPKILNGEIQELKEKIKTAKDELLKLEQEIGIQQQALEQMLAAKLKKENQFEELNNAATILSNKCKNLEEHIKAHDEKKRELNEFNFHDNNQILKNAATWYKKKQKELFDFKNLLNIINARFDQFQDSNNLLKNQFFQNLEILKKTAFTVSGQIQGKLITFTKKANDTARVIFQNYRGQIVEKIDLLRNSAHIINQYEECHIAQKQYINDFTAEVVALSLNFKISTKSKDLPLLQQYFDRMESIYKLSITFH